MYPTHVSIMYPWFDHTRIHSSVRPSVRPTDTAITPPLHRHHTAVTPPSRLFRSRSWRGRSTTSHISPCGRRRAHPPPRLHRTRASCTAYVWNLTCILVQYLLGQGARWVAWGLAKSEVVAKFSPVLSDVEVRT